MSPGPKSGLVTILNISHTSPHFKRTCETPRWPDTGRPVHLRPPAAYSVEFTMTVSADPRPMSLVSVSPASACSPPASPASECRTTTSLLSTLDSADSRHVRTKQY